MSRLSGYQLFCITLLFQLGTTVIFGSGSSTGRDGWIVTILSAIIGIMLIRMYISIMNLNPGLSLVEWYPRQFGKWIGVPIAWLYPLMFLFDAGRIIGDLRDLIPTTILPTTPPLLITFLFILVIVYGMYLGLQSVARVGEILVPFILFLFVVEVLFLLFSHIVDFEFIKPILWDGWSPVLRAVFPEGTLQTFGETIALAVIWIRVERPENIWKNTLLATVISSLSFLTFDLLSIMIFGGLMFERSIYPFYSLSGMVNIEDFITNLNPFAVIYFIVTAFFKLFLKMYTGLAAIQILFPWIGMRKLIWPSALCVLLLGFVVSDNVTEHIYVLAVQWVTPYFWLPLFVIFPLILFIVSHVRQRLRQ
ncbi:endospore germination permease [Paenibacillus taichungensis]|uniref:Endospore germination permease n=1 Tax=Paenibacillus taichungensis TaxID=484184 RepID=A0ABX2MCK3_9BACL|nr:endospore germination permease [Paenibacillus taichungensis]NUU52681.1 endospore germination permease [Paenibacillus taichungensis]